MATHAELATRYLEKHPTKTLPPGLSKTPPGYAKRSISSGAPKVAKPPTPSPGNSTGPKPNPILTPGSTLPPQAQALANRFKNR